jgi:hypothetical protein
VYYYDPQKGDSSQYRMLAFDIIHISEHNYGLVIVGQDYISKDNVEFLKGFDQQVCRKSNSGWGVTDAVRSYLMPRKNAFQSHDADVLKSELEILDYIIVI